MSVVLDTNALMMPVECDVRVFEELDRLLGTYDPVVPAAVLAELDRLAAGSGEPARAANVGRDLAGRCERRSAEADTADDAVRELSLAPDVTHAVTNDGPLRTRLLESDVPVICLRGENKLAITQP
jgi:rRNA-processing protein FCF1